MKYSMKIKFMKKQIKLVKTIAEDLAEHKSEDFMELYFDFVAFFDKYFEEQALEYIKSLDDYSELKVNLNKLSFIEKLVIKLKNFVLLWQNESNWIILDDLISIWESHDGISITDDFALEYAEKHAWELVTQINETTEKSINLIISNWIKKWLTIKEIATNIKDKFADFSLYRSSLIAQMETWTAYYIWNDKQYDLYEEDLWVTWFKHSFTQWDSEVRPSHKLNEADWWIPRNQKFSWTDSDTPPYDFGCRCYKKISIINLETGKLTFK